MAQHWLAELDGRRVVVEVPASSANLGAGYDCLGVALELTNRVELEVRSWSRGEIELTIDGEGRHELTEDRDNRFIQAFEASLRAARGELPEGVGWRISMRNEIPLARGLGSSAAASVAGVVAANALLGEPLSITEQLRVASEIEGHPDNAAAALLGGFVVAATTANGVEAIRFDVPRDLRAVLFIPELRLSTRRDAADAPDDRPARRRGGQSRGGRARRGRARHGSDRPAAPDDDGSAARAVSREGLSAAPAAHPGGPRRRGPGRLPVGCRIDGPGLHGLDGDHHPDRRGVLRRGCRYRPAGRIVVVSPRNAGARVVSQA